MSANRSADHRPHLRVVDGQAAEVASSPIDRLEALREMAVDPQMTYRSLKLAVVIAAHANSKTGFARPSVEGLAAETGINRRDVQREMRRLEQSGLIVSRRGGGAGRASSYALTRAKTVGETPTLSEKTAGTAPALLSETAGKRAGETAGDSTPKQRVKQRVQHPPQPATRLNQKPESGVPRGACSARAESTPQESAPRDPAAPYGGRAGGAPPAQDLTDLDFVIERWIETFCEAYPDIPRPWTRLQTGVWELQPGIPANILKDWTGRDAPFASIEDLYRHEIGLIYEYCSGVNGINLSLARKLINAVGPKRAITISQAALDADDPAAYVVKAMNGRNQ